jgi:2-aminobenzoate-CoA ligase
MADRYPTDSSIPAHYLVGPDRQPDYTTLPGADIGDHANVGIELSDRHVAGGRGANIAMIHHDSGQHWTFADLAAQSTQLAGALAARGVGTGDRVAIRSRNQPEAVIAAVAIWKAGGVVVPTPAKATADELRFFLDDTEADHLIADPATPFDEEVVSTIAETDPSLDVFLFDTATTAGPLRWSRWSDLGADDRTFVVPQRSADHVALIWHTGGTTGTPKACYHTHRRFLLAGYATTSGTGVRAGERWAAGAPIGHALGFIYHTNFTLLHGATVVTIEQFHDPAAVLDAIEQHGIDTFTTMQIGWSRMLATLEREPDRRIPSLRRGFAMWQSPGPSAVRDGWRERGVELLNNFGSTSFAAWPLVARPGEAEPGSLGRPTDGYEVIAAHPDRSTIEPAAAGEPGLLAIRGPSGLTYWRRPELQEKDVRDGWTVQDDLIRWETSGNATYLGRTDFLISTVGYKVTPIEVEAVLASHHAVAEVCVVGIPDAERQESVAAVVVPAPGFAKSSDLIDELRRYCKERLSSFKIPREFLFVDALPRDHVGKIQPRIARELLIKEVPR